MLVNFIRERQAQLTRHSTRTTLQLSLEITRSFGLAQRRQQGRTTTKRNLTALHAVDFQLGILVDHVCDGDGHHGTLQEHLSGG